MVAELAIGRGQCLQWILHLVVSLEYSEAATAVEVPVAIDAA